jgi:hypothetical protein
MIPRRGLSVPGRWFAPCGTETCLPIAGDISPDTAVVIRLRDHYLCTCVTPDNGDRALLKLFLFRIRLDLEHREVQLALANLPEKPAVSIFKYKIWCSILLRNVGNHLADYTVS